MVIFEQLRGPLRFCLLLPVIVMDILIILLNFFLWPFLPLWHWVKSRVVSKVTWLQVYVPLEIYFEDWVGGTGCLHCDWFFPLLLNFHWPLAFLLALFPWGGGQLTHGTARPQAARTHRREFRPLTFGVLLPLNFPPLPEHIFYPVTEREKYWLYRLAVLKRSRWHCSNLWRVICK